MTACLSLWLIFASRHCMRCSLGWATPHAAALGTGRPTGDAPVPGRVSQLCPCGQLPSKPHSTGLCAVRRPSHTPIVKQTNPRIRARSDTRPQNLAKAVVMAARRWFASSLRQISRFYSVVKCEISVDNKKSPAEAGQPWMGRGLASTCFRTLGGCGHRRNDKEKPFDNRSPYWLNDSGVP